MKAKRIQVFRSCTSLIMIWALSNQLLRGTLGMFIGHYGVAPAAKKASLRRAGSRDAVPGSVVAYFRLDRHRTGDDFAWNHPRNSVKLRVLSLFAQSFGGLPLVAYCWRNLFFCPPLKNRGLGGSPAAWRVTGCSTLSRIVPTSRCTRGRRGSGWDFGILIRRRSWSKSVYFSAGS
jgi:hypothetical protein